MNTYNSHQALFVISFCFGEVHDPTGYITFVFVFVQLQNHCHPVGYIEFFITYNGEETCFLLDAGAECVISKGNILVLLRQIQMFLSLPLKHDAFLERNLHSIFTF